MWKSCRTLLNLSSNHIVTISNTCSHKWDIWHTIPHTVYWGHTLVMAIKQNNLFNDLSDRQTEIAHTDRQTDRHTHTFNFTGYRHTHLHLQASSTPSSSSALFNFSPLQLQRVVTSLTQTNIIQDYFLQPSSTSAGIPTSLAQANIIQDHFH